MKLAFLLPLVGSLLAGRAAADTTPEQVQFFEAKVRPLLATHCYACHGPKKQSNGLRLDSAASVQKGGDSGPVLMPGKPNESLIVRAINHADELKMPPKGKLKTEEIAVLTEWVRRGAPWPKAPAPSATTFEERKKHWSFQPVTNPSPPPVKDAAWPRGDVDRFVLARLEARGLAPVGPADKLALLRRATYDLTGLPPTPDEIAAFAADPSPDAFARVVERLLAAPAYGERWGRHWLDVVRYADTAGDNSDYPIPQMVLYRDWVIKAFNEDKPYDQYLREQLAGDLMPAATETEKHAKIIATGYLANARRFGSVVDGYPWHLVVEDTIDNLGRTMLGLTVNCARCHDHKFDPISTEDYYALYGFFQSTRYPWPGIELDKVQRDLVPLVPAEKAEPELCERQKKYDALGIEIKRLEKEKSAAAMDKNKKRVEELDKALKAVTKEQEDVYRKPLPFPTAYAVAEGMKKIGNARVQIKGEPERLGKEVPRRFPSVLGGQTLPPDEKGSGRLRLAEWLTDPKNPLVARVLVNRVWQWHFGRGLVPTPSDFGKQGQPPSHPELLDHLARRFVESGWSIKALHRTLMLSRTYQLASSDHAANAGIDPNNDLYWRFNRRRLDAEEIRDTLLVLGGNLERGPGGPHPFPAATTWDFTQHKPFKAVYDHNRRSVYLMTQRIQRHPFLSLFDGPDPNASTPRRVTSTTPLQALYLMNEPFVHEQAKRFAARLQAEHGDDRERIERAYLLAFGRPATTEEYAVAEAYLAQVRSKAGADRQPPQRQAAATWESYVRGLYLSNEFVYLN